MAHRAEPPQGAAAVTRQELTALGGQESRFQGQSRVSQTDRLWAWDRLEEARKNIGYVRCQQCELPAMINQHPNRQSNRWIHRRCWSCAVSYYVGTVRQIADAAARR